MRAIVFPGQGSQIRGMGDGLFDTVDEYTELEPQVDGQLGYSLREMCLNDGESRLKQTQYTQPCLYVVNALHYYHSIKLGMRPDFVAGHSLGEYNALLAAGSFDFVTGLQLVKKRGELMAQAENGGMAAIVGVSAQRVDELLRDNGLLSIDVASYNSPVQTVISGPSDEIVRARSIFEAVSVRSFVPLQVSAAFHSRGMADAAKAFAEFLESFVFERPMIPVIANVTAKPYPTQADSPAIRSLLVSQITQPVRWMETVRHLAAQGVTEFVESGPGTVLTRLIQQIRSQQN